jgi:uncharacterized protein YdeI (YjbR/CyaY-like superfamily)
VLFPDGSPFSDPVAAYLSEGCGRCSLSHTPACKALPWNPVFLFLRPVLLEAGLDESRKWGVPCYSFQGQNVVLFAPFRDFCALSFLKGVLLADPSGLLKSPGKNSRSAMYLPFSGLQEAEQRMGDVAGFLAGSIELVRQGATIARRAPGSDDIPGELQSALDADPGLAQAFLALTPGRQRSYLIHISGATRPATREKRVLDCIPSIRAGKGFRER